MRGALQLLWVKFWTHITETYGSNPIVGVIVLILVAVLCAVIAFPFVLLFYYLRWQIREREGSPREIRLWNWKPASV
jgi:hypothetical protein